MCYFLTVGVPKAKTSVLEQSIPRGLAACPTGNPTVLKYLGGDYATYLLISGDCSCDLYSERLFVPPAKSADSRRRKYQKMGWSPAKIERAMASVAADAPPAQGFAGLRPDVRELLAQIAEAVGSLFVMVHWYDGDLEKEAFSIRDGPTITAAELRAATLPLRPDEMARISGPT